jgi:hypothetical protein
VVNIYGPENSTILGHYAYANSSYQSCEESQCLLLKFHSTLIFRVKTSKNGPPPLLH